MALMLSAIRGFIHYPTNPLTHTNKGDLLAKYRVKTDFSTISDEKDFCSAAASQHPPQLPL